MATVQSVELGNNQQFTVMVEPRQSTASARDDDYDLEESAVEGIDRPYSRALRSAITPSDKKSLQEYFNDPEFDLTASLRLSREGRLKTQSRPGSQEVSDFTVVDGTSLEPKDMQFTSVSAPLQEGIIEEAEEEARQEEQEEEYAPFEGDEDDEYELEVDDNDKVSIQPSSHVPISTTTLPSINSSINIGNKTTSYAVSESFNYIDEEDDEALMEEELPS